MMMVVSQRITQVMQRLGPVAHFFTASTYARRVGDPGICDFAVGNPHELALPGFVEALGQYVAPQNNAWFAYKNNEPEARAAVTAALRERRGLPFEVEDVFLTNGAFAALAVVLGAIVDPGDEVIFLSPPWFFYEALIAAAGAQPIRVKIDAMTFDLDVAAIEAAIGPRTRAIIINSPHNPTGKIYSDETLKRLALVLAQASARIGHPIYLISDEAYSRIIFDERAYHSPTAFYPHTFLVYTYGKTLLTPGQRLGYIALPPTMSEREQLRTALFVSQLLTGYAFPNALLQHALSDLEQLSIDVAHLQHKRDLMVAALHDIGYDLHVPEGTFYLLPRSPLADDLAFIELLAEQNIFCLPGTVVELPGYFRISLTANDAMIEQALPGFATALQKATQAG
jgi:aspartate aminotransferase